VRINSKDLDIKINLKTKLILIRTYQIEYVYKNGTILENYSSLMVKETNEVQIQTRTPDTTLTLTH
jgi:hypothetical protein